MSKAEVGALRERWRELFGCEPARCGSIILPGAVACGQQVAKHGDIPPALLRDAGPIRVCRGFVATSAAGFSDHV